MNHPPHPTVDPADIVAVLLHDGWHRVNPGSFTTGTFGLTTDDTGVPGYHFEEPDNASPHPPATLAGPLDTLLAIRQVTRRTRRHKQTVDDTVTDTRLANGTTRDMRRVRSVVHSPPAHHRSPSSPS
jgi:hypothetical protein